MEAQKLEAGRVPAKRSPRTRTTYPVVGGRVQAVVTPVTAKKRRRRA